MFIVWLVVSNGDIITRLLTVNIIMMNISGFRECLLRNNRQAWEFSTSSWISANFVCPGTFLRLVQIWGEKNSNSWGGLGWFSSPNLLVKFSVSCRHWPSSIRCWQKYFGACRQSMHCSVLVTSSDWWRWRSELSVKGQLSAGVWFLKTMLVL